jgi:phenylacetate-CoA ligase
MSIRSTIHGRLLIPAFEAGIKRRKALGYWAELDRSQWLPAPELEKVQFETLRRLVTHAEATCPYYREAWAEAGLNAADLRAPEDFLRWPVIDREIINANRMRMRCEIAGQRLIAKATGGSSGVPLRFDLDEGSNDRRTAAWHRGYSWAGAAPGTRQFYLWGVPLGGRSRIKRIKDRLYNALYHRLVVSSFDLSEERVPEFLGRLNRYRPEVIVAYTNPLDSFARALEERELVPYSPRSIVVGAEKLHPFQRERIERVFRAPVFETYGSREFMLIGAECDRHEGLHLTAENLLVEILDEDDRPASPGTEGEVVVTDLYNLGMPFVRYRTGDRAVAGFGACSCGRGLPLLGKVVGRTLDILRTGEGRMIPGEFFPHLFKEFDAIRRFQVVQREPDHIEIRAVLRGDWSEADRARLDREVLAVVGPGVRVEFVQVDDIPLTAAGKLRVVVSLCGDRARAGAGA